MPEESPVGASAANAMMERSVWDMQRAFRGRLFRTLSGCTKPRSDLAISFWNGLKGSQDKWTAGFNEEFRIGSENTV